ncbi:MAG: cobalamin biosynthesis protein P47K [Planctomycetota bacterium]|nr:cobalamin biosynthesis protein P47K [Planctomycetota bacterium]
MLTVKYIMIGGFLGSGKTTSMLRAAEYFSKQGLRVGLISNDQSQGLVDTNLLSSSGFATEEISGGCFCCRFPSLLQATEKLDRDARPDVYLAEPVGSCTDLVATVVYPLEQMVGHRYSIAPLSVLVDPIRAQRFLGILTGKTFSPKVNYIYGKQLEEAELIVINKKELLDAESLDRLTKTLEDRYPKSRVLSLSARTGEGLEEWFTILSTSQQQNRATMEVDYDLYAQGEALLGWVNFSWKVSGPEFDGNDFLKGMLQEIHEHFVDRIPIAHLKGTLLPDQGNDIAVANLVREDGTVEQSHELLETLERGELTLNLRAEADPEMLREAVEVSLQKACQQFRLEPQEIHSAAFRPLPPTPTYRLSR